ncbi:MAG: YbjN domain-containing protein [Chloroflexi bacterium]|nr:YbjN domain-containing protein [Chloroflexota bacterium]MCL5273225.1 YbjN domain-containing protein [Chloroflexota bacterium]
MGKILDALAGFINANQWPVLPGEDQSLRMFYQGKNGRYSCVAQALEEQGIALFYSIAPINVPAQKRQVVAEYLTRVNYGLLLGNFEMDFEDGEVRCRTSASADGIEWSPEMMTLPP